MKEFCMDTDVGELRPFSSPYPPDIVADAFVVDPPAPILLVGDLLIPDPPGDPPIVDFLIGDEPFLFGLIMVFPLPIGEPSLTELFFIMLSSSLVLKFEIDAGSLGPWSCIIVKR
jgi:hypothetical protein